jgi:glycine cleavage system transcriptional repressor
MTHRWIVTALGKDRPGIVAGVTKTLYGLGCNLEDSAMTRLEGEFAIMLIFSSPVKVTERQLHAAFESLERRLTLVVHLKPLSGAESRAPRKKGQVYRISVYGADRPGIVFRISEALARAGINITDVHTHRSSGGRPSLYLMLLEIEVPPKVVAASLEARLKKLGKTLGVETSLQPAEANVL